jgi:hypothetical protein
MFVDDEERRRNYLFCCLNVLGSLRRCGFVVRIERARNIKRYLFVSGLSTFFLIMR